MMPVHPDELRACIRDLIALSSLPAVWSEDPQSIAESLADALRSALSLEMVDVELRDRLAGDTWRARRTANGTAGLDAIAILPPEGTGEGFIGVDAAPGHRFMVALVGPRGERGRLVLGSKSADFPRDIDRVRAQVAANQAAVAMRAAELLRSEQRVRAAGSLAAARESRRAEQLRQVSELLNSETSLPRMLEVLTDQARMIIGAHMASTSFVVDGDWASAITTNSLSEKFAAWRAYEEAPTGAGIYAVVCERNKVLRLTQDELETHTSWRGFGGSVADHPPLRGWLAAPLTSRRGENLGLTQLSDKEEGEFTAEDETLLVQLTQMASVAIANAQYVAALREEQRLKDLFLATLAHELRNPLGPILNAAEALAHTPDSGGQRRLRRVIERQAHNLARIVDDLLDVSRITAGKIVLDCSVVDLRQVVRRYIEALDATGRARDHTIQLELPAGPAYVNGDSTRLEQILGNLVDNALKYSPAGRTVHVVVDVQPAHIVLRVRDEGVGIETDMLPRVFETFSQADRSLDRAQGGLGLGLALARGLTELHGGNVRAHSAGPETGSEFVVAVPRSAAPTSSVEPPVTEGSARHVLLVEDRADAREAMSELLRALGHRVEEAPDGPRGVAAALEVRPDVAFVDIGLPGLTGWEVAAQIRAGLGQSIWLFGLTGYAAPENAARARDAGFDGYMVKPVGLDELLSTLERCEPRAAAAG